MVPFCYSHMQRSHIILEVFCVVHAKKNLKHVQQLKLKSIMCYNYQDWNGKTYLEHTTTKAW